MMENVFEYMLLLTVSMALHEMGHYLVATASGIGIDKICLFLDPGFRILDIRIGRKTRFCVGWIPIGAYVRYRFPRNISCRPEWFLWSRPAWQQTICASAGIAVNLLTALACLLLLQELERGTWIRHMTASAYGINMGLALFNLIPVPPLDGGAIAMQIYKLARGEDIPMKLRVWSTAAGLIALTAYMAWYWADRLLSLI